MKYFIPPPDQINKSKGQESQGNLSRDTTLLMKNQNPTKHVNLDLNNVDPVSSNVRSSRLGAMLYVFEDNEAVIKMIIKGRSPTMRHVSRTHCVALDSLYDRINLDPQIRIRYIDTKHQFANKLTNGNCTRDEWNNLLHFFNISHFLLNLLLSEFQLDKLHGNDGEQDARTGRRQQDRGKVKADDDEPGRLCLDKFLIREPVGCVEKPGDTPSIYRET